MDKWKSFLIIVWVCACLAGATALGDLAATMERGTWAELQTIGFNRNTIYSVNGAVDVIVNYSDNAVWDSTTNQFLFVGAGHGGPQGFMTYSASTNTWRRLSNPPFHVSHAYQNNAIDQQRGIMYHHPGNTDKVYPYNISSGSWGSALPSVPGSAGYGTAIDFFTELGCLVRFYGGRTQLFNFSSNTWKQLTGTLVCGGYHNIGYYNPVHKAMLLGGGNSFVGVPLEGNRIYKLDATETITTLKLAPTVLSPAASVMAIDPITGVFLIAAEGGKFYAYDISADTWDLLNENVPWPWRDGPNNFTVATSVWNYGVAIFVWCRQETGEVHIYKYADPTDSLPVTAVKIISNQTTIGTYEPHQLKIAVTRQGGIQDTVTGRVVFNSLNPAVAGFNDPLRNRGLLIGKSPGQVNIEALFEGMGDAISITVIDTTPPSIASVISSGDPTKVLVKFSEPVKKEAAEVLGNYSISGGITISSVVLLGDQKTAELSTTAHNAAVTYTLTVNNIKDLFYDQNVIAPNSTFDYQYINKLIVTFKDYFGYATPPTVGVDGFVNGAPQANDRADTWSNVPSELSGLTYLLTARNDKNDTASDNTVYYKVNVGADAVVYALMDGTPDWLATDGWVLTQIPGPIGNYAQFNVYAQIFPRGDVYLKRYKDPGSQGTSYVFDLAGNAPATLAIDRIAATLDVESCIRVCPNPFNPAVTISFTPAPAGAWRIVPLRMGVVDIHGRLIESFDLEHTHRICWNAGHLPSGIYLLDISFENKRYTKRLVLSK